MNSTDGGESWNTVYVDAGFSNVTSIQFIDQDRGWMVASNKIFNTTDGGESLQVQTSFDQRGSLNSLFFLDDSTGWCAGSNGNVLKTTKGKVVSLQDMDHPQDERPDKLGLGQNYPNPFVSITNITCQLQEPDYVKLAVYNILGMEVMVLVNGRQSAGKYRLIFDGSHLESGIYFYKLSGTRGVSVKEMQLIR